MIRGRTKNKATKNKRGCTFPVISVLATALLLLAIDLCTSDLDQLGQGAVR
jgi:hypothetical protein